MRAAEDSPPCNTTDTAATCATLLVIACGGGSHFARSYVMRVHDMHVIWNFMEIEVADRNSLDNVENGILSTSSKVDNTLTKFDDEILSQN